MANRRSGVPFLRLFQFFHQPGTILQAVEEGFMFVCGAEATAKVKDGVIIL